jgi:hypothetical protein
LRHEWLGVSPSQASVIRSHRGPDFSSSASKPQKRLANLKVDCASVPGRASIAESEAMPPRYAVELIGAGRDSEKAMWLIALMVLCGDPLAIALTAAASAQPLAAG